MSLSKQNELFCELKDEGWIKNPVIYSQIRGDFSLVQTSIMLSILSTLQSEFQEYLNRKKRGGTQLSLFDEDFFVDGQHEFIIKLADLDIPAYAYKGLEDACDELLKMSMSYDKVEEDGQSYTVMANVFSKIEIPQKDGTDYKFKSGKRRTGIMKVYMLNTIVDDVFDLRSGYVEHVRRIVSYCVHRRTPRLYIYLSRWKNVGHKLVDFMELKEFLGVLQYDKKRTKPIVNKFEPYWMFALKVLDPIKQEMDELAALGKIDFTFDYKPIYNTPGRNPNPDQILFTIKFSDMGKLHRTKNVEIKDEGYVKSLLKKEYNLRESEIKDLYDDLTDELMPGFNKKVLELKSLVAKYNPASVRAYVIVSLRTFIDDNMPRVEEIKEEEPKEVVKTKKPNIRALSVEDKQAWTIFLELAKQAVGVTDYETWVKPIALSAHNGDHIILTVPNKFFYEHVEECLIEKLALPFQAAFGDKVQVDYRIANK